MATSWSRAAAVLLCAVCAAGQAPGVPARTPSAGGRFVPVVAARPVFRLRMPSLPLPSAVVSRAPGRVAGRASRACTSTPADPAIAQSVAELQDRVFGETVRRGQPATRHTVVAGDTLGAGVPGRGTVSTVRAVIPRGAISRAAAPVRSAVPSRAAAAPAPPFGSARRLALLWPSRGIVTSRFGWRVHPIFGGREFHTGVDIATRYGSPVVAARAGVVRFVGWKSGYGRIIVIAHGGGIETAYSHLSAALVNPGQRVAQGQMIGRIGSSGWSTGPHLFFEVRRNGVPMDPARYLN